MDPFKELGPINFFRFKPAKMGKCFFPLPKIFQNFGRGFGIRVPGIPPYDLFILSNKGGTPLGPRKPPGNSHTAPFFPGPKIFSITFQLQVFPPHKIKICQAVGLWASKI